jgi:NAD(P)-dependent dehydrogenase (short-subunit alcohol dehydrogenase family)
VKEFTGKVAVITGAASGIGRAIAERCAQEGMKVVLADVEAKALAQAEEEMCAAGATILAVLTDVSKVADIKALAQKTLDAFGAVHLLCNNAGVGAGSTVWESTLNDWTWTIGVNLWGVIHGLRAFVPIMLKQNTEAHIVNTSSIAGLISFHEGAAYHATKHAIVALSEKLHYDMAQRGSKIKVSVLCPAWVRTRIMESERNRPTELMDNSGDTDVTPEMVAALEQYRQACATGLPPNEVADQVFQAIKNEKLYILTHPEFTPLVQARMEAILQGCNPMDLARLAALVE